VYFDFRLQFKVLIGNLGIVEAKMGFFGRLWNVIKGFFGRWIGRIEEKNPELVYESAIQERLKRQKELKKAVSGIMFLRNKTEAELKEKEAELEDIDVQIEVAVDEGEEPQVERLRDELKSVKKQADAAMEALNAFREDIKKLKREKEAMLAKAKTAEARIKIEESLSGLSVEADSQALENVRTAIEKKSAEADVSSELNESSIDSKLKEIKAKSSNAKAKARLAALKRKRKQAAGGGDSKSGVNKNI
jgi:phage shock protein A